MLVGWGNVPFPAKLLPQWIRNLEIRAKLVPSKLFTTRAYYLKETLQTYQNILKVRFVFDVYWTNGTFTTDENNNNDEKC